MSRKGENNMKVNDKIRVHIYGTDKKEIQTRHINTVFAVYEKNGKLGIDWSTKIRSSARKYDPFVPFEAFSPTVIFENVETKELYHFDNMSNSVVRVA